MIKSFKLLLLFATIFLAKNISAQNFNGAKLEKITQEAIKKAYPASVKIFGFDTVKNMQNSSQFSGAVVSADGYILTAAHAIQPDRIYKVFFPDGRECLAKGLGRIALTGTSTLPDAAMMKIIGNGTWPFVEMGWSYSLKVDEPCISISYPDALAQKLPLVRFGRIKNTADDLGFIQSTCVMELGDSGGALYDYNGRLIGIHSRCLKTEEINQEVPIDLFRKYWTALNSPENYTAKPSLLDEVKKDPLANQVITEPALANLPVTLSAQAAKFRNTEFLITSKVKNQEQKIVGTLITGDDWKSIKSASGSLLISKSSCVGDEPMVLLPKQGLVQAKVLFRSKTDDLVLLTLNIKLDGGIKIDKAGSDTLNFKQLGTILFSPRLDSLPKTSVLGSTRFSLPLKYSLGYLGATSVIKDNKVEIYKIQPGSPANIFSLATGDVINNINGATIANLVDLQTELQKYTPGDKVNIALTRNTRDTSILVMLANKPSGSANHNAEKFEGGKSKRRDGFENIFGHDARIRPEECGGPVLDLKGNFYGINIARFSRVVTLAIPVNQIRTFLQSALSNSSI